MLVQLALLAATTRGCSSTCIGVTCFGGAALLGLGAHQNSRRERDVPRPIDPFTGLQMIGDWRGRTAVLRIESNRNVPREDGTSLFVVGESGHAHWCAGYHPPTGTAGSQRAVVTKAWWGVDEDSNINAFSSTRGYDSTLEAQQFIEAVYQEEPWFPTYDPFPGQTKIHVIEWKLMDRGDAEVEIQRIGGEVRRRNEQRRQALAVVAQQPAYYDVRADRDGDHAPAYAGGYHAGGYDAGPDVLGMAAVAMVTDDPFAVAAVGMGADPLAVIAVEEIGDLAFGGDDLFGW